MKFKVILLNLLAMFLLTSSSFAMSFTQDYWTITDYTTAYDGTSFFQIEVEQAAYESDFGLYIVDDINNASDPFRFEVFDKNNEEGDRAYVSFLFDGSDWLATTDNPLNEDAEWTIFDSVFGFYYGVYTDGSTDTDVDYYWYTDITLNADGQEHIGTDYVEGWSEFTIYLDDQYGGNADRDFTDMTVFGNDLQPVPEPATMLLLGSGLLGLAGIRRKKK